MTLNWNNKRKISIAVIVFAALAVAVIEIFFAGSLKEYEYGNDIYEILIRGIGAIVFLTLIIMLNMGNKLLPRGDRNPCEILFLIPCFAIAINNFPIVSMLSGDAYLDIAQNATGIGIYALKCFFVGCFEELAFRGFVFLLILERMKKNTVGAFMSIFISSVLFGVIHIVNLFAGADPVGVLLQVGYSALIGALCSVVLIKTRNLWYCVSLHAIYNFCGGVVPAFGGGVIWTVAEVVVTVVLSLIVTAYVVFEFVRIPSGDIELLLNNKKESA
jgi:membrane protease YdiL (CAAX protease family)